ncbi:MAG: cation diffusion facilitator family transporter [Cyclobacteriaceae bacterium]
MGKKPPFNAVSAAWLSIILNFLLFIFKYWAGVESGSVAIIADAWHTLSDSASSAIVIIGIRWSSIPADNEHPFGHGRAEVITSVVIGVMLGLIALNFFVESVQDIRAHEAATYGTLAIASIISSIVVKEIMAQYSFYIAKKTKSDSLHADGWHHRSDALSSIIVLIGIILAGDWWWIDGAMGIIITLMLGYATYEILRNAINKSLGEKPDSETMQQLNRISEEAFSGKLYLHHTHIHVYGDHKEITFHIKLPPDMTLEKAHDVATILEKRILYEMEMHATIHMEPLKKLKLKNHERKE